MDEDAFFYVPQRLKEVLGKVVNVSPEEVILGNSTSYGIHLLANGLPLKEGDEVLLVKGDFPADILPWLALERRGVKVRFLNPEGELPMSEEIAEGMTASTRVFCTANFMNFLPWTASLEYLLKQGLDGIETYDQALVSHFIGRLDLNKYHLLSPRKDPERSTLVLFSHQNANRNSAIYETLKANKIDISLREGNLRVSPHLYNTTNDIDHLLSILDSIV
ncbi:MAG: aminotransferase class V-fold PLP-dependent enzyme [Candidatus Aminicenantes bacterium]|nr:aminotransferase class V-fold PLP-dependent enzyme [Candidatus Aminicenantes bacterium]